MFLVRGETHMGNGRDGKITVVSAERVGVREASGVAEHPAGFLLIVDDEAGIYAHTPGANEAGTRFLEPADGSELNGCEGIAVSGDGRLVYVVAEGSRKIFALPISIHGPGAEPALGVPRTIGR